MQATVTCRCGASALRLSGEPLAQLYCHCDDCQLAHSAAYVGAVIFPAASVEVLEGEPVVRTIRTTPRLHCASCGSYLFAEIEHIGLRSVNAWLFERGQFHPQMHVQCRHAVLPVVDDLPHFAGFPPQAGGSDERVGW